MMGKNNLCWSGKGKNTNTEGKQDTRKYLYTAVVVYCDGESWGQVFLMHKPCKPKLAKVFLNGLKT